MRNSLRITLTLCLLAFSFVSWTAKAQETGPGDACTVSGEFMISGGPEITGGHLMVCDGANWLSFFDYVDSGKSLFQVN